MLTGNKTNLTSMKTFEDKKQLALKRQISFFKLLLICLQNSIEKRKKRIKDLTNQLKN